MKYLPLIVTALVAPALATPYGTEVPIGGDRDEHGCYIGAGQTYCPSSDSCIQAWITRCPVIGGTSYVGPTTIDCDDGACSFVDTASGEDCSFDMGSWTAGGYYWDKMNDTLDIPEGCIATCTGCIDIKREDGSKDGSKKYTQIKGDGSPFCWEVRNGKTRNGNKIILGKCNRKKDEQKFIIVPVDGGGVTIHPKLKPKKIVAGVREEKEKAWLRIEPTIGDETQIFSVELDGKVHLGTKAGEMALYITNHGLTPNRNDPVMLTTFKHIENLKDTIKTWTFL